MTTSPSSPPPLEPLDVLPMYATPARSRPAIVTLMGVTAIVIATLSLLASGVSGMVALGMMIQTQVSRTITAAGNTRVTATARYSATGNVRVNSKPASQRVTIEKLEQVANDVQQTIPHVYPTGPRGVIESQRLIVEDALGRSRPLSKGQTERLDQLLAKAGKDVFPFGIATDTIQTAVSESGTLGSGSSVANYYLIPSGKLEVYDDRAVFVPGTGEPVRVHADDPADEDGSSNALSSDAIDGLIASVQTQTGNKLTPPQVATLRNELGDPNQSLVIPGGRSLTLYATMLPDNSVTINGNTFLQIGPAGNIVNSSQTLIATASKFAVRGTASTMTLLDAFLSGALGIYLLVVGILVLRQNRRGRGLQMAFAILKIPVAVLAAIGWKWTIQDASSGTVTPGQAQFWLWTFLLIGLAYPIVLLIALQARSVRDYYNSVRAA